MPHTLQTLVLVALAGLVLPQAVWAVEPNVGTETKSNADFGPPDRTCVQVPDKYQTAGPFTVRELEAESLRQWDENKDKLEGSVPRVPFGKASAEWKQFLRQLRKGDELFMYDEGCCTGIIIVRKSCIVDWFPISES
jgi:hypothetical protein